MAMSTATMEAARRLWEKAATTADTTEAKIAAAERVGTGLRAGLVRWIGRDGYHSLLLRALEQVRPAYPWMAGLRCEGGLLQDMATEVRKHSAADVAGGMLALIGVVVDVLGRITGEEMAIRLVEQAWTADAPVTPDAGATSSETRGSHDG